jgi:hypothetical protein
LSAIGATGRMKSYGFGSEEVVSSGDVGRDFDV